MTERYHLYGLRLHSHWPLPYDTKPAAWRAEVELTRGSASELARASDRGTPSIDTTEGYLRSDLSNGAVYLRWSERFEFLIAPDGRRIDARPLAGSAAEAFHAYLLGQALSFALIKQGLEPLHAAVVESQGRGIAFLGDSGYGKSSLAAAFVQAGHALVTDDLLLLTESSAGFTAYPGPPRIKLFPKMAGPLMSNGVGGSLMGARTTKRVFPVESSHACQTALPLKAVYVLAPPRAASSGARITFRQLSARQACLALVGNTFNMAVIEPARLERQLALATSVALTIPVRSISYPRRIGCLPRVRETILADLER